MPMNQSGSAMMAAGGMPQGGTPPSQTPPSGTTVAAQGNTTTTQITEILDVLKQIIPQVVDEKGYVNMDRLITLWPQFSQVPFQVVMQLIQQSPELLNELVAQFGLSGFIVQGRSVSGQEAASLGGKGGV